MKTINQNQEKEMLIYGLPKLMRYFNQLILILREIAEKEKTLDSMSTKLFSKDTANENNDLIYEEIRIMIQSELKESKSRIRAFNLAKYMLVLFESLNGYLAAGILLEMAHIDLFNPIVKIGIQFTAGVFFSLLFLHNAVKAISPKSNKDQNIPPFIPFIYVAMLPLLNMGLIFVTSGIENKFIYIVTAIFTLIVGSCIVLQARSTREMDYYRFNDLKECQKVLEERKKLYQEYNKLVIKTNEMRPEYIGLFNENFLKSQDVEQDLIDFIKRPNNWSEEYIKKIKNMEL